MGFFKKAAPYLLALLALVFFSGLPQARRGSIKMALAQGFQLPFSFLKANVTDLSRAAGALAPGARKDPLQNLRQKAVGLAIRVRELELENQRLRGLLEFKRRSPFRVMPVEIVGRDFSNFSQTLLINQGSRQGIRTNLVVVDELGLVGRVIEVGPAIAKVLLVTDPNSRVSALVQRSREEGIVEGTVWGALRLRYLGADADVTAGDIVLTSGLGGVVPKGIVVGTVTKVEPDALGLSRVAWIAPAARLSKLEEVLCLE